MNGIANESEGEMMIQAGIKNATRKRIVSEEIRKFTEKLEFDRQPLLGGGAMGGALRVLVTAGRAQRQIRNWKSPPRALT